VLDETVVAAAEDPKLNIDSQIPPQNNEQPRKLNEEVGTILEEERAKAKDLYEMFMGDPRSIANYLNLVPCPMFYGLIIARLKNNFYRQIDVCRFEHCYRRWCTICS
jgi:hypothetical protein